MITKKFLRRYVVVEGFILGGIFLVTQVLQVPVWLGMILVGIVLVTMPFMGGYTPPTAYGVYRDDAARNEINHMVERMHKRNSTALINPVLLYGLPPLILGFVLSAL